MLAHSACVLRVKTAGRGLRRRGLTNNEPIANRGRNAIEFNAHKIAENAMWDRVAERDRASEGGVGRVELRNSRFSRSGDGEFTLVRAAADLRMRADGDVLGRREAARSFVAQRD